MTSTHAANTLLYILPCFALLFLTSKDKFHILDSIKIAVAILIFMAITFYGSGSFDHYRKLPPKFLFIALAAMLWGSLIFNFSVGYHFRHSVFIVAIAKCYSDHMLFLSIYIYFLMFKRLPACTSFELLPFSLSILTVTFPLIFRFFRNTLRQALDYSYDFSIWHVMWIVPVCNNFLFNLLFLPNISNYNVTPDDSFYYAPPIWIILTFATYTITLWMAIVTSENTTLLEKYHVSETMILSQQKQAENLQAQIEQTSRMRHDMRHHLLVIETRIKDKDWETLSDTPLFPDIDFCSVLANLLENAVEACSHMASKERFINLKLSSPSNSILAIVIENSYDGEITCFNDTFISSKEKNRKGIGISSVRNIVEQYNGVAKFEYQDYIFRASIMMRIA